MKNLFLYKVYKHSRLAFAGLLLFIALQCILIGKKMDMLTFPFNNMFALAPDSTPLTATYAIRLNGQLVPITHHLYWKKDFLETSLHTYGKYKELHDAVYLEQYIKSTWADEKKRNFLLPSLTPGKKAADQWPVWFCHFAGVKVPSKSTLELVKYRLVFEQEKVSLFDSTILYKIDQSL
jgi:hypothetical protein